VTEAFLLHLSADEVTALCLSVKVAAWCTLVSCPFGILVGWVLARRSFPGKPIVDALVYLPMVLPPVVPGYFLLVVFGNQGVIGHALNQYLGISFAFNWKGAVLASALIAFPLMVQSVRLAMRLIDARLEQAASTLGAGPWRVFLTITLPLAAPGVIIGSILTFSRSLGEFGATMSFVGNIPGETRTLPLAIYSYTHLPGGETPALHLITISIVLAMAALLAANALTRRTENLLGHHSHADR
jgi:molybdate transport system permease protein